MTIVVNRRWLQQGRELAFQDTLVIVGAPYNGGMPLGLNWFGFLNN